MLNQITFNRSEKCYELVDETTGQIFTAPAGQKHQVFKTAVAQLHPDLFAALTNWLQDTPQLERTVWRGVAILLEGKLDPTPQNDRIVAMVDGSDEFGRYAIQETEHGRTCQCMAYREHPEFDRYGRAWCKHLAAYHLHLVAETVY